MNESVFEVIQEADGEVGYQVGQEVELQTDPDWQPVPDVIGALTIGQPYPITPVDVVVEILSPYDKVSATLQKCREYARIGVKEVFVLDPDQRVGWRRNGEENGLIGVEVM